MKLVAILAILSATVGCADDTGATSTVIEDDSSIPIGEGGLPKEESGTDGATDGAPADTMTATDAAGG